MNLLAQLSDRIIHFSEYNQCIVVLGYFVSSRRGFVSLARACPDRADT